MRVYSTLTSRPLTTMTTCYPTEVHRRFAGIYGIHLQVRRVSQESNQYESAVSTTLLALYVGALHSAPSVTVDNTLQTIKYNPTYSIGGKACGL